MATSAPQETLTQDIAQPTYHLYAAATGCSHCLTHENSVFIRGHATKLSKFTSLSLRGSPQNPNSQLLPLVEGALGTHSTATVLSKKYPYKSFPLP